METERNIDTVRSCEDCGQPGVSWEDVILCDNCALLRAKKWQTGRRGVLETKQNDGYERVVQREWRCVNEETEGIGYVATEREHGRNARFNAEGWLATLGPKYHLELWERIYYVSPSEYRRLYIDGDK